MSEAPTGSAIHQRMTFQTAAVPQFEDVPA